ncbi:MAG: dockerin type I domain-containing protein [Clostridiales bacterium]|nr:dockerin type I domain-containing protein [Clostridiales bacterium]
MSNYINSADPHLQDLSRSFLYKPNYNVALNPDNPDTTYLTYDDIKYTGPEAWDPIWWSTADAFAVDSWYTGTEKSGTIEFKTEYGDVRTRNLYTGSVPAATVPTGTGIPGSSGAWGGTSGFPARWSHYLVRGYACIYGQLLGNRDGEGITNSQHVEEWLSAAAACKWLAGEAKAYTTRTGSVEAVATWANGHVAMDGTSYPGTTPTLAAMTGVPGLKAIMPEAHVASWYEYYRSGGALHGPEGYGGEDMNLHSSFNFSRIDADCGSINNNPNMIPPDGPNFTLIAQRAYTETQYYMMEKQDRTTGDYNTEWDYRNLTRAYGQIRDDVGILQTNGQQDWNVMPRHAYQPLQAWRDKWAGTDPDTYGTHKLVSGLSNHASQNSRLVPGKDGISRGMQKWYLLFLDHYLLGLDNHVDELMYDITSANQKTGVMEGYDFDNDAEERGTILPGFHYQKIYMSEGPGVTTAGRLSFTVPQEKVEGFTDMNVSQQISYLPRHPGAPTTVSPTIGQSGSYGNLTPTSTQYNYCDDRVVGVNRTTTAYAPYSSLIECIDRPVEGRLMYISEPLKEDLRMSGTVVVHLNGAPTKKTGNLTVALLEIGRIPRLQARLGNGGSNGTAVTVFPVENGAAASSASPYTTTVNTTAGILNPGTARAGSNVTNFKYVTWGHTDIQNPSYDGKAWFEVPDHNYVPDYYFQTTAIEPGKYYNYVVELNPYNYVFEKGCQIAVMVYGTDAMASPNLDTASTGGLDLKLGAGTYIDIPLQLVESEGVTIEVLDVLGAPGGTVDVTYSIKGNDFGFTNLDLKIPYNSAVYTPVGVAATSLLSTPYFVFNPTYAADTMRVAFASDENILGNDVLFTVKYQVAAGAPGTGDFPLNLEPVKLQYEGLLDKLVDLDVAVKPGTLVIGLLGDVNADGFVTPEDAMLILQMIVGLIDWTPRALLLGDINGDGKVDTTDAALILRMVVGG